MTYRDELTAAIARADSLQRELDELCSQQAVDRVRVAQLEAALAASRRELGTLRRFAPNPPTAGSPHWALVAIALGAVAVGLSFFFVARKIAPEPEPLVVAVEVAQPQPWVVDCGFGREVRVVATLTITGRTVSFDFDESTSHRAAACIEKAVMRVQLPVTDRERVVTYEFVLR